MKKFLSVALALAMTLSLVVVGASAKSYTDNSKIKYGEAVDVVSGVKIVDGYTDGSFNPGATLTRGAAAKIICNMMLGPTTAATLGVSSAPFKDVSTKNVFAGYIAYCAKQGIINGYTDKTFRPAGTVNGYQFMKMLLGALGYDGSIEGFTGSNWEVTVAKLASNLKLFSGLSGTFAGSKAMTREEACLYAYNTLTATMVEYENKGSEIIINGVVYRQGASKASKVANDKAKDYRGSVDGDEYMQFCEQYFSGLKYSNTTDAFQAPAEKWKNGSSTIGSYTYDADETYTAAVSVGKIYTDLGLSASPKTLTVYEDGKQVTGTAVNALVRGGTETYGGNGAKTEVFVNNSAKTDITIVVINTYVAQVSSVTAATSAKDRFVAVNFKSAVPAGTVNTFETDKFAAKDLVSFTVAYDGTSAYDIQDMNALTKTATGKLVSYTAGKNLTVADKTYDLNSKAAVDNGMGSYTPGSSDMDIYCDAYGYALYVEGTQGVTNYATVIGAGSTNAYGSTSTGVTLLLADGTQKAVTAKMATGSAKLTENSVTNAAQTVSDVIGDLVTYSVDANGVYTLTVAQNYNKDISGKIDFTNGRPVLSVDSKTLYTTSNTVFFVCTGTEPNLTYAVYTGYAKMPTLAATNSIGIAYSVNAANQVNAVYLSVKELSGINAVDTFVVKNASSAKTTDANGTYYVLPAIVDGKVTTVKISDISAINGTGGTGLFALKSVLESNGVITSAAALTVNNAPYFMTTGIVAADKGVIGVGSGTYLAYNDKTAVYTVDKDFTSFTASSVGAIATDKTVTVYYTVDSTTGVVTNIILVPAVVTPVTPVAGKYATGVDKTVKGASDYLDLSKAANAQVAADNKLKINVLKSGDEVQQMKDALAYLGYTVTKATKTGTSYTFTATKSGVEYSIPCDTLADVTYIYTVTVDGVKTYAKVSDKIAVAAASGATNPGTGYVVDGKTYAAYGDYTVTAADATIVTGYVKVAAPTDATYGTAGVKAGTVTYDPATPFVKAGGTISVTIVTTANTDATKGGSVTVTATGATAPTIADVTKEQAIAGKTITATITVGQKDITALTVVVADK